MCIRDRTFRALLEEAMPREEPGKFNQALMELGATVCAPNGAPDCGRCPLSGLCEANRLGIQTELPLKSKKAPRREIKSPGGGALFAPTACTVRRGHTPD